MPECFEYWVLMPQFKDRQRRKVFLTVLDSYVHHFTNVKMYHVRLEDTGILNEEYGMVHYEDISEDELNRRLSNKVG